MLKQDSHFYFSLLYTSAVLMLVMAGGGVYPPATIGTQPPFQTLETSGYEASGAHPAPVESCLDDNPNPGLSCL
jgi:hypothetical protein